MWFWVSWRKFRWSWRCLGFLGVALGVLEWFWESEVLDVVWGVLEVVLGVLDAVSVVLEVVSVVLEVLLESWRCSWESGS